MSDSAARVLNAATPELSLYRNGFPAGVLSIWIDSSRRRARSETPRRKLFPHGTGTWGMAGAQGSAASTFGETRWFQASPDNWRRSCRISFYYNFESDLTQESSNLYLPNKPNKVVFPEVTSLGMGCSGTLTPQVAPGARQRLPGPGFHGSVASSRAHSLL